MAKEQNLECLKKMKAVLIKAHDDIMPVADLMEAMLPTEADLANSKPYGLVCYVLGMLEERVTDIHNEIKKLK